MTARELMIGCEHDGSYIPVREVERLMKEYARIKCLEAIEKTKDKAYNLLEEWCDAGNPNVKIALDKIENIQNESVLSLIK